MQSWRLALPPLQAVALPQALSGQARDLAQARQIGLQPVGSPV